MKIFFFALTGLFFFSSSKCKKEGENCHHNVNLVNNSPNAIIVAFSISDVYNNCQLSSNGKIYNPTDVYIDDNKNCWESEISESKPYNLYIVDPNNYNAPFEFYSCDSIEIKNTVLKHYVLTLDELRAMNFTISYP